VPPRIATVSFADIDYPSYLMREPSMQILMCKKNECADGFIKQVRDL